MKKDASAMLAEGLRGDETMLTEAAHQFRSLHDARQKYCRLLGGYLQKRWKSDANVLACSLARTTSREAIYTFVVYGAGTTYSIEVAPKSKVAYDVDELDDVGKIATQCLAQFSRETAE